MGPVNLGVSLFDSVKLAEDVWQERLLQAARNRVFIIILAIFLLSLTDPSSPHRHRQKIFFYAFFSSGLASGL